VGSRFKAVLVWQALVCLVVCSSAGCTPPPKRVELNDKIARATRKLFQSGKALRNICERLKDAKDAKLIASVPSEIASSIDATGELLTTLGASFEGQQVPVRRSNSAQGLVDAFAEFLKVENDIYNTQFAKIKTIARAADFGAGSWGQIEAEFASAKAQEDPAFKKLQDAQKAFADEHFFRFVPTR
jgi:hypothetical protein